MIKNNNKTKTYSKMKIQIKVEILLTDKTLINFGIYLGKTVRNQTIVSMTSR